VCDASGLLLLLLLTFAPRAPRRLLALDHREGDVYALALAEPAAAGDARAWLQRTCGAVEALAGAAADAAPAANGCCGPPGAAARPAGGAAGGEAGGAERPGRPEPAARAPPPFRLRRPRRRYLADVQACLDAMCAGESYELCLTTALARRPAPDVAALYSALRRINPAPYAAFLAFGAGGPKVGARPGPRGRRHAALCARQEAGVPGCVWCGVPRAATCRAARSQLGTASFGLCLPQSGRPRGRLPGARAA